MRRYRYKDALSFEKTLKLYFYTSNVEKLLQARIIFGRHGYFLEHYRSRKEPYDEDYTTDTRGLLEKAVRQLVTEFRIRLPFFIEDTSLRIDALSDANDFPGMRVKEWFKTAKFETVQKAIRARGGNSRCTVKSDIALHIPGTSEPLLVHGETSGVIASAPPGFMHNFQYPWLTPHNFNGWMIPDGSTKRLGEMEFEESLEFDFRARSLVKLLEQLRYLNAALNIEPGSYQVARQRPDTINQLRLSFADRTVVAVIGHKCAGKTTFGDNVLGDNSARVIEASAILREIGEDNNMEVASADGAEAVLRAKGYDIVAKKIYEMVSSVDDRHIVITGLRTIEELLYLARNVRDFLVVNISTDSRLRFERHTRRGRDQGIQNFDQFRASDERQAEFGIMRVANEIADFTIRNDGSIEAYRTNIANFWGTIHAGSHKNIAQIRRERFARSELVRSLAALHSLGRSATCDRISAKSRQIGQPVRLYNTNRALKAIPELAARLESKSAKLTYQATARGGIFLSLIDALSH